MARVKIHNDGVRDLFDDNGMRALLLGVGQAVKANADSTAQDAQRGPGGTISGYAEAGFSVEWVTSRKRPQVWVVSNADPETALDAYFYSQKKNGVTHLRAALYRECR